MSTLKSLIQELLKVSLYKPNQGKIARRLTFLGLLVIFLAGSWCIIRDHMFSWLSTDALGDPSMLVALVNILFFGWFSWRLVNFAPFADFLVSVEAEMTKVSWPSKTELFSTTKVVMIFMVLFIALIYVYDFVFNVLFSAVDKFFG
ncbi:MAG: preprotein translocase subunit SecE [Planctomycetia bacterium]|nr:preprotein translocase subunit SecE [Planctomycetia bacterium]